jgi:two-component system phosphate regulon sensor histidine kinase PhoR
MPFKKIHEGSGIGLSLVKSLVEKHNGTIKVKSELGKGTEFIIELPRVTIPIVKTNSIPENNLEIQSHVEKIKIEFADIYL